MLNSGWWGEDGAVDSSCSVGHPRICSLGGVGYLGSVTTHPALAARRQQKALGYSTCWRVETMCNAANATGLNQTVQLLYPKQSLPINTLLLLMPKDFWFIKYSECFISFFVYHYLQKSGYFVSYVQQICCRWQWRLWLTVTFDLSCVVVCFCCSTSLLQFDSYMTTCHVHVIYIKVLQ